MRNSGATYNLNDPALALYNIIDRAAGLPERGRPEDIRQRDTIIIYLGNMPEAQQEQKKRPIQRLRGKTRPAWGSLPGRRAAARCPVGPIQARGGEPAMSNDTDRAPGNEGYHHENPDRIGSPF